MYWPSLSLGIFLAALSFSARSATLDSSANDGLELPYVAIESKDKGSTGEIATGWEQKTPAGQDVVFSREAEGVKEGKSCQRMTLKYADSKEVEFTKSLTLEKSKTYRFAVWMKADSFLQCRIFVRQTAAPYTVLATKSVALTPEWRLFEIQAKLNADAVQFGIGAVAKGSIWVDDFQVGVKSDASLVGRQGTGNFLDNGSFETGLSSGWSMLVHGEGSDRVVVARVETEPEQFGADESTAVAGKKSLKIALRPGQAARLSSPLVTLAGGDRDYVESVSFKSDGYAEAALFLIDADGKELCPPKRLDLSKEWKRLSLSGKVPAGTSVRMEIRLSNTQANPDSTESIWVDAAQLEEGKVASDYADAKPVELLLTSSHPGAIFFDQEPAFLDVVTGGNIPPGAVLKGTVEDLLAGTKPLPDLKLPATRWTIPADAQHPRGMFKVRGVVVDSSGRKISSTVEKVFARLPRPREIDPERSYFGCHVTLWPDRLAIMRAVGMRWVRMHDASSNTLWPNVEASRDKFQFYDRGVDAARAAGFEVLGLLNGAPLWSTVKARTLSGYFSAYNIPDVPDGMERWGHYVNEIVTHYKGRIHYWEVWNEPWIEEMFFPGTPKQYGEMLKVAYGSAKEADPSVQVVAFSVATCKDDNWLREVLKAAGTNSYDIFAHHDYNQALYGGKPSRAEEIATKYNGIQKEFGEVKPGWNSEGGSGEVVSWYATEDGSLPPPRFQMTQIVRFNVTQMAAGVHRFFYYTMHGGKRSGEYGLGALEYDHAISPTLGASAVLASLVDGAAYQGRVELKPKVDAHKFRQVDGTLITVVWVNEGGNQTLPLPDGTQALDILGNPLPGDSVTVSAEPIYLVQHEKAAKK